ncbi:hypothetical protein C8T65DRAFT_686435 [Cerioporus squamosus]|nr:hypothetical protein C8T65DRAFT_686435 [Cerioporus squamosus]
MANGNAASTLACLFISRCVRSPSRTPPARLRTLASIPVGLHRLAVPIIHHAVPIPMDPCIPDVHTPLASSPSCSSHAP